MNESNVFADLPVLETGWDGADPGFQAGEPFWTEVRRLAETGALAQHLDEAMAERPSPRVWFIVHEPGAPEMSATAALALAAALAGRGQAALVLDCDEQGMALTIWAEREETEGWIDVARYGASVLTAGEALPFPGRRGHLLGVGSFTPTDITPDEIAVMLKRLRRQADDLILVGPAGAASVPWLQHADVRLLCWNRTVRPASQLANMLSPFTASGAPLTGLLGFGAAAPEAAPAAGPEATLADELAEAPAAEAEATAPATPAAGPEPAAPRDPEPALQADVVPAQDEQAAEAEPAPPPETDTGEAAAVTSELEAALEAITEAQPESDAPVAPAETEAPVESGTPAEPELPPEHSWAAPASFEAEPTVRKTSGVFWLVVVALSAFIVIISTYYLRYVRVPPEGHFGRTELARRDSAEAARPQTGAAAAAGGAQQAVPDDGGGQESQETLDDDGDGAPVTDAAEAVAEAASPPPAAVDEQVGDDPAADETTTERGETEAGNGATTTAAGGDAPAEPQETTGEAPAVAFDMAPYTAPVGQAGWAVHVYSVPDSAGAHDQELELERMGFATAERIVEIKEKGGRWWRIYVGSFATRAEAAAALPALYGRLGIDWAKPERF